VSLIADVVAASLLFGLLIVSLSSDVSLAFEKFPPGSFTNVVFNIDIQLFGFYFDVVNFLICEPLLMQYKLEYYIYLLIVNKL
jgi:hypothetical protein